MWLGTASLVAFVVLRAPNVYGDPSDWTLQSTTLRTLLSFVNVQKYPPSLHYLLITLGVGLLLLALFESARGKVSEVLRTFGRVPLFFYVLHVALAHLAAGVVGYAMGFGDRLLTADFLQVPQDWGFSLPVVYLVVGARRGNALSRVPLVRRSEAPAQRLVAVVSVEPYASATASKENRGAPP